MTFFNRTAMVIAGVTSLLAWNWSAACGWFVAAIYSWNEV